MNLSPMENSNIRKKQISVLTNSSNYILDKNNELEDLNTFKSNTFYLDSNHQNNTNSNNNKIDQKKQIESYIDSLVKNKLSEQNNEQISNLVNNEENENENDNNSINNTNNINENDNQFLSENEDKYNSLILKNKELIEENKNLSKTIKNNELIIEEQNSVILLLKTNIENDFFKNNDIKKYVTIENIVDFIKLKNENEQYKKELVLSQALVNSLQSENHQLLKEKENLVVKKEENKKDIDLNSEYSQNNESVNIEMEDFLSNNSGNKIDKNLKENELINELIEENKQLKRLIQEATVKLNYLLINEKNNKAINENINILNIQLNNKINIIKEYEEKFEFFNSYISENKSSFINMQNKLVDYINAYNKMANDDLNSLLSSTFSQSLMKLSMKIGNLMQIEQYNLESKPELDIHEILLDFISSINDEFLILYEKVFQTNSYYKESNNKINELERQIKENRKNYINTNEFNYVDKLINDGGQYKNEYIKTINKLNLELSLKENEIYYLKELSTNFKNDLEEIINILIIIMQVFSDVNKIKNSENNIVNYIKDYIDNLKNKINLIIEKEKTVGKIIKNNNKIKNMKLDNKMNNNMNLNYYKDEYINKILKDSDNKIKQKQNYLYMIKENLNFLINKIYKSM